MADGILPDNKTLERLGRAIRAKVIPTWIYVIGPVSGAQPVKIGIAYDPPQRLRELQAGSPVTLEIHYTEEVGSIAKRFETAIHRALSDRHSHGEWFSVTPDEARVLVKKMVTRIETFSRLRTGRAVRLHIKEIDSPRGRSTWEIERDRRRWANMERRLERQRALAGAQAEAVDAPA